jgi:hypothetical protein
VRKDAVRTIVSLNRFQLHLMAVFHTLTNIPRMDFSKVSSTSSGRFRLLGSISMWNRKGTAWSW